MTDNELLHTLALNNIPGLGVIGIRNLMNAMGDAVSIFEQRNELQRLVPGINSRLIEAINEASVFEGAEKELAFIHNNHIIPLSINDDAYPSRLRECDDAPIFLFFKGETNLNAPHIISMVGTRNATEYGKQLCEQFICELKTLCPDIVIVSGLAYGIDIHAHRGALNNQLDTVGVLAHGLDRIYPSTHRSTAVEMLAHGGLLTEYLSGTNPDRQNFVRRNRIVAGMSDATIVVESAAKGGGLITADIAQSYHRDCFAFPGRVNDEYSIGCNNLIRDNKAALIRSAEDFVKAMCWDTDNKPATTPVQRQLFPDLTDEEQNIVTILQKEGDKQINSLVVETNIPINRMTAALFTLEMKGVVKTLAGGMYQLLH
ncbi:MAG: DNA-processing protein DprA [Bacteroidaceae bacterium]